MTPTAFRPVGWCYCGCGHPCAAYFVPGHETRIVLELVRIRWGSTAAFVVDNGRGPRTPIAPGEADVTAIRTKRAAT